MTIDPAAAYAKLVERRRGGWCYEMNGVLGWALGEIGFDVMRMAGGAMRAVRGDIAIGNHLALKVIIEGQPWIADVGFGDGSLEPYPLQAASFECDGYPFRLELQDDGYWRLHNHPFGGAPNFDFQDAPADEARLAERCEFLQTAPESNFVLTAVVQRHRAGELLIMRGRVLRTANPTSAQDRLISSADEYVAVLKQDFALDLPEAAGLWPKILARHEVVMNSAG